MTVIGQEYPVHCAAPYLGQPLGYQQITASTLGSATGLTVPANAAYALIGVEGTPGTDTVRWRDDGTAPTSSVGMLMNNGTSSWQFPWLYAGDLAAIQFIKAAGSPILNVSYYR